MCVPRNVGFGTYVGLIYRYREGVVDTVFDGGTTPGLGPIGRLFIDSQAPIVFTTYYCGGNFNNAAPWRVDLATGIAEQLACFPYIATPENIPPGLPQNASSFQLRGLYRTRSLRVVIDDDVNGGIPQVGQVEAYGCTFLVTIDGVSYPRAFRYVLNEGRFEDDILLALVPSATFHPVVVEGSSCYYTSGLTNPDARAGLDIYPPKGGVQTARNLTLRIDEPVGHVLLTDPEGKQLGHAPDGSEVNDFADRAMILNPGQPESPIRVYSLSSPESGTWKVHVAGTDVGPYTLRAYLADTSEGGTSAMAEGDAQVGSVGRFRLVIASPLGLLLKPVHVADFDNDGDGDLTDFAIPSGTTAARMRPAISPAPYRTGFIPVFPLVSTDPVARIVGRKWQVPGRSLGKRTAAATNILLESSPRAAGTDRDSILPRSEGEPSDETEIPGTRCPTAAVRTCAVVPADGRRSLMAAFLAGPGDGRTAGEDSDGG